MQEGISLTIKVTVWGQRAEDANLVAKRLEGLHLADITLQVGDREPTRPWAFANNSPFKLKEDEEDHSLSDRARELGLDMAEFTQVMVALQGRERYLAERLADAGASGEARDYWTANLALTESAYTKLVRGEVWPESAEHRSNPEL